MNTKETTTEFQVRVEEQISTARLVAEDMRRTREWLEDALDSQELRRETDR